MANTKGKRKANRVAKERLKANDKVKNMNERDRAIQARYDSLRDNSNQSI